MNGTTGSQEAGQFAGDTPLTGHNIQGHSINVMLVRDMPAEVLRTSVTHFGTRGLFGQPVRRTGQHDQDNVRRKLKRWRVAQSAKPKVKPKPNDRSEGDEGQEHQEGSQHSAGVASPVPDDTPGSVNKPGEKILDLSPPFRSSSSPTIATPSSLQTSFTRSAQVLRTGSLPVVHEKKTHYSRSQTLPSPSASKSATMSPTSAGGSEHVPSPCHSFSEPNMANPSYNSPTDLTVYPSRYSVVSAGQGHMPLEAKQGRTSTGYGMNAAESVNNCGGVDASASASPPIRQVSSGVRVATAAQQTVGTVLRDGLIVDANVDARHSVTLPTQSQLRHETTSHWRREASLSAPSSDRSLSTSAGHESWSNQVQASAPSCLNTAPGETHLTWYGYSTTAGVYANPGSAIGVAACSSIAPSPGVNTYVQNYAPPLNRSGTSVWSSATSRHEGEGWVVAPGPPPGAYPAYSAAQSPATAFNQYAQGDNTLMFDQTVQSDEHIRALVDLYTRPPSGACVGGAIGSSGPVNTSTSAPEAVWPMAPEPHLQANGTNSNLETCYGGASSVGASGTTNAYPSGAVPAGSGTYYPHTFVGDLDTSTTPLWAHLVRPMDPMCEDHDPTIRERGLQQEHAAYPTASWTHRSGSEPEYPVHGADNRLIYSAVATSDELYNAQDQNCPGPTG